MLDLYVTKVNLAGTFRALSLKWGVIFQIKVVALRSDEIRYSSVMERSQKALSVIWVSDLSVESIVNTIGNLPYGNHFICSLYDVYNVFRFLQTQDHNNNSGNLLKQAKIMLWLCMWTGHKMSTGKKLTELSYSGTGDAIR